MSVFTSLDREVLEPYLATFGLGRLLDFQGIAEGSENSNFFISLSQAECVLTLVERGPVDDLPFFITLLDTLHDAGLAVPFALRNQSGTALNPLAGKPAILQPRLSGTHVTRPNAQHCQAVGQWLARLHLATGSSILERTSDRGLDWMQTEAARLRPQLDPSRQQVLDRALDALQEVWTQLPKLPRANLHADLFRDNVMFEGTHLTGVIDFYNACSGPMLYDVAITLGDWCCSAESPQQQQQLAEALLAGYAALRPFVLPEADVWLAMRQVAGLRFWLSRLIAAAEHAGQPDVKIKDPEEFCLRLQQTRDMPLPLRL